MLHNAQCPVCRHTFYNEGTMIPLDYSCPNKDCLTKVHPIFFQRKCLITINWDDLRVLTWFSMQWANENWSGTDEGISLRNIINFLEHQRQMLIKATGRPEEFGHLTQFSEEREKARLAKRAAKLMEESSSVSEETLKMVNDILLEKGSDDEDDELPSTDKGAGKPVN